MDKMHIMNLRRRVPAKIFILKVTQRKMAKIDDKSIGEEQLSAKNTLVPVITEKGR